MRSSSSRQKKLEISISTVDKLPPLLYKYIILILLNRRKGRMQDAKIGIRRKIGKELAKLAKLGPMLKGTVSKVELGIKKTGAERRVSFILTYKGKGNKTRTIYIGKKRVPDAKKMIGNYKKMKCIVERLVELNVQLFKLKE